MCSQTLKELGLWYLDRCVNSVHSNWHRGCFGNAVTVAPDDAGNVTRSLVSRTLRALGGWYLVRFGISVTVVPGAGEKRTLASRVLEKLGDCGVIRCMSSVILSLVSRTLRELCCRYRGRCGNSVTVVPDAAEIR